MPTEDDRRQQVEERPSVASRPSRPSTYELKGLVDEGPTVGGVVGSLGGRVFGETVRRRLWTKADFMHLHAVSGAYFLGGPLKDCSLLKSLGGTFWLLVSVLSSQFSFGFLESSLLGAGLLNSATAIPMARFSSDKILDFRDLKANGFTLGGAGLTCMSCWVAWWFSGAYPAELEPLNPAFFALWTLLCVGTTVNWEVMLRSLPQFEDNGRELREKTFLYRLASWPNLTQLLFLSNMAGVDSRSSWFANVLQQWPLERIPLYHYGFASAVGYALSMFSETLRDRKLVSLRVDLIVLVVGVFLPVAVVLIDGLLLGDQVTVNPLEYWRIFNTQGTPS